MKIMLLVSSLRTASKVNEMLGSVNTSSALSAFEKMEEKGHYFIILLLVSNKFSYSYCWVSVLTFTVLAIS